ncbi:hypothetical protein ACNUDN_22435 [Mycobacterium sp. smrl_JER01]|uniref:hypothetical protein n=1 Tax=Mycobacterium sp. smrl_JER01 TaxID=3402633 RepID=UPI003AC64967
MAFIEGLDLQRSYLSLRETVDPLLTDQQALDLVAPALHDALLPRLDVIAEAPLLAGLRLDVVLEIVVRTTVPPYKVLDLLTGPMGDFPEDFNDPLARAIGVAADLWTNPAEQQRFATSLDVLTARGCEDAGYESAVLDFRIALASGDKDELVAQVQTARDRFTALAQQTDGRDDAQAFARTCDAIVAFHSANKVALATAATEARDIAKQRALLVHGMHSRERDTAGVVAELAWTSLAWRLETASVELEQDAFLDTWVAVDAIIDVYEADRQLANLGTITSLIRPRIVNEIAQREAMAHQLERAVEIDRRRSSPELPHGVYALLDLVHRARSAGRERTSDSQEPSHETTYLGALLGPAVSLLADLSGDDRIALEESARQTFIGTFAGDRPTNDLISRLTAQLIRELGDNATFTGNAKSNFSLLVLNTVRFLTFVGDTKQTYTEPIAPGATPPPEADLQKHFHQFLSASELAGRVGMEHSSIAGGRADVITTFDGAQRFVTEVKRELSDASRSNVENSYLAQALEYQSTNQPLGQLLVLDLTDHTAGTPHINESIWVTHRRNAAGTITSSAVVAIVRGNRPSPSAMR